MSDELTSFQDVVARLQERELEKIDKSTQADKEARQALVRQSQPTGSNDKLAFGLSELLAASGLEIEKDPNAPGGLASVLDAGGDDDDEEDSKEQARGFPAPPKGPAGTPE